MTNARFSKLKRHTGAGGFVRSSAIENDFMLAGNFMRARTKIVGPQNQRIAQFDALALNLRRMAQIYDRDFLA